MRDSNVEWWSRSEPLPGGHGIYANRLPECAICGEPITLGEWAFTAIHIEGPLDPRVWIDRGCLIQAFSVHPDRLHYLEADRRK